MLKMDHFVFSLLLIVLVTTTAFGSVIKAKNPNGEEQEEVRSDLDSYPKMARNLKELEALLKRSHDAEAKLQGRKSFRDQDKEDHKSVAPGEIIDGTEALKEVLDKRANVAPSVKIVIANFGSFTWRSPIKVIISGTSVGTLPRNVAPGVQQVIFQSHDPAYQAVKGVLAYDINIIDKQVAVMWCVDPTHKNLWNVKLYDKSKEINMATYKDMERDSPFNGDDRSYMKYLGYGVSFEGTMSASNEAGLHILFM